MIKYKEVEWGLLEKAHERIESSVGVGDMVVDATLGNGHDTLFLAQCVGPTGKVIGFDVQQAALDATRKRLLVAGIGESSFELHLESHVQILEYVPSGVSAVVFNLGYLPGADKSVITQVATTLEALTQSMDKLRSGGVLSVMCYPGHSGGDVESEAVIRWMEGVSENGAEVTGYRRKQGSQKSPFLLIAQK